MFRTNLFLLSVALVPPFPSLLFTQILVAFADQSCAREVRLSTIGHATISLDSQQTWTRCAARTGQLTGLRLQVRYVGRSLMIAIGSILWFIRTVAKALGQRSVEAVLALTWERLHGRAFSLSAGYGLYS